MPPGLYVFYQSFCIILAFLDPKLRSPSLSSSCKLPTYILLCDCSRRVGPLKSECYSIIASHYHHFVDLRLQRALHLQRNGGICLHRYLIVKDFITDFHNQNQKNSIRIQFIWYFSITLTATGKLMNFVSSWNQELLRQWYRFSKTAELLCWNFEEKSATWGRKKSQNIPVQIINIAGIHYWLQMGVCPLSKWHSPQPSTRAAASPLHWGSGCCGAGAGLLQHPTAPCASWLPAIAFWW